MNTRMESAYGRLALHRVLDPDHAALKLELARLSRAKSLDKFPAPSPCSLERADFPRLKEQPYFLAEKTDGIRFLAFCCVHRGLDVCCIVDRAMTMYLLPLQALPTACFQGTVFDCELARNKPSNMWHMLAFDAYVVSGIPVAHKPFSFRMRALNRAMGAYEWKEGDPVHLRTKYFVPASMFDAFVQYEQETRREYDIDGVILVPELSPAAQGRQTDLFKLKTKHTVDFLVGSNGLDACVFEPKDRAHTRVGCLRTPHVPGAIVECLQGRDGAWDVVCVRSDKRTANDMLTYTKTVQNMQENITMEELRGFLQQ